MGSTHRAASAAEAEAAAAQTSAQVSTAMSSYMPVNGSAVSISYAGGGSNPRQGAKGNPLAWTMSMVYGGLTVFVIIVYMVWGDGGPPALRRAKPDNGLP